jgi:hypothetical protein
LKWLEFVPKTGAYRRTGFWDKLSQFLRLLAVRNRGFQEAIPKISVLGKTLYPSIFQKKVKDSYENMHFISVLLEYSLFSFSVTMDGPKKYRRRYLNNLSLTAQLNIQKKL